MSTQDPEEQKITTNEIVVVSVLSLILISSIIYFVYVMVNQKEGTIFDDIKSFYGTSVGNISIALFIAFLVSDVVGSFNQYVMAPIVQSIFPGGDVWQTAVHLPRDKIMYPGLLFQSAVSFVLSIGVLFSIVYFTSKVAKFFVKDGKRRSKLGEKAIYAFVAFIIFGLIIWNIVEILKPDTEQETQMAFRTTQKQQKKKPMSFVPSQRVFTPQ